MTSQFLCVCGRAIENAAELISRTERDYQTALAMESTCDCGSGVGAAWRSFVCGACSYGWLVVTDKQGSRILPFSLEYQRLIDGKSVAS